jgi:uncharacterized protein
MKKMTILRAGENITLNTKRYRIESGIGHGLSGEVYKISKDGVSYALKIFFPFYRLMHATLDSNALDEISSLQLKEYKFLSRISHPNIVKVIDHGSYDLRAPERGRLPSKNVQSLPFLIEEFVQGKRLGDALEAYPLSAVQVGGILSRICQALRYLHQVKHYMHADIKSANILVREVDYQPIIVDFALSKNLDFSEVSETDVTPFACDWDLLPHMEENHPLKKIREREKGTRQDIFNFAFPTLDLYDFGKMLKALAPMWEKYFGRRDQMYLDTLVNELTDWETARKWDSATLEERISRLAPEQHSAFGVPELTLSATAERTIMLPPDIGVPLTPPIQRILENRSFRRLSSIHQLSLLSVVYPAADYKRLVHVLHAYHLARQFATRLYSSPQFRLHMDPKSCQRLLATVLTHDINHFPFLHIFQEAQIPRLKSLDLVDLFCAGELTGERQHKQPSLYELLAGFDLDPTLFKRLIFGGHADQRTPVDQIISSFVNSGADVDKMSYLFLDSYFTGIKFGAGIDYSGLLKSATIERLPGTNNLHIAFSERGIQAAENLVMTRYWNFRSLYWHHTNRAIMAMVLHVVRELYLDRQVNVESYLADTMWMSDVEAVRYLDRRYRDVFNKNSVLHEFPADRRQVYRRLYTVRAGGHEESDNDLHKRLRSLNYASELLLRKGIAQRLAEHLPLSERQFEFGSDDVLVDIPRREMDSGGKVYIAVSGSSVARSLDEISKPVAAISSNYELLTKRIRFFVSPRIAEYLGKDWRERERNTLYKMISDEVDRVSKGTQIS